MSADDLELGDGSSGAEVLSSITNYISGGGSVTTLISSSILGLVVSPFVAAIDVINAVTGLFTTPFESGATAIGALISAIFTAPGSLVEGGFEISEAALSTFLGDSLAGILAGPVAVGVVMLSLYLVIQYLQEPATGDTLPGVPVDLPFVGIEEDDEG